MLGADHIYNVDTFNEMVGSVRILILQYSVQKLFIFLFFLCGGGVISADEDLIRTCHLIQRTDPSVSPSHLVSSLIAAAM